MKESSLKQRTFDDLFRALAMISLLDAVEIREIADGLAYVDLGDEADEIALRNDVVAALRRYAETTL